MLCVKLADWVRLLRQKTFKLYLSQISNQSYRAATYYPLPIREARGGRIPDNYATAPGDKSEL